MKRLFLLSIVVQLTLTPLALASTEQIYDEHADAQKQIAAAIAEASGHHRHARNVVLVFGANWWLDCHALDAQMHKPEMAAVIEKSFRVVKIDVGRMDKNVDLARKHGVRLENGIPALAVLDCRGKLLYAQDQGQFADARHMTYESIKAFFIQWALKK